MVIKFGGGFWVQGQLWKWGGGAKFYMAWFYFLTLISWFKYFLNIL
jgi:hypothetical protein